MDKVQKHNSFNTNTPSSESYRNQSKTLWRTKLINSRKPRMACGIDGVPNECLRHLPRRPLVRLIHLFNHCLQLSHFPSWKEAKVMITLLKPGKDPKFLQNLWPISFLFTAGKLFEKVILKIVQRHVEENNLLDACTSQHDASMHEAYRPRDPKLQ
jgi:hypothetical protein